MTQTLANRYRPLSFDQVVGHERYVKAFTNLLKQDTMPSCILLAGASGTGKTTLSRLIAAGSVCTAAERPCNECLNCLAVQGINDGPNFMHMDGSSTASRETVENKLTPFLYSSPIGGSRYKVCIADEAQALGQGAKNSLLTLTENLPKRSIFIMTTTDPEAIDVAVRTRSFKVNLPSLTKQQLVSGIVTSCPHLKTHTRALAVLAEGANGSLREMWQLVQQLESFEEEITVDLASWMTQTAKWEDRKVIWQHLKDGKLQAAANQWDTLVANGAEPSRLGEQLFNDLLKLSASNPTKRDWVYPIRILSQAQVIGRNSVWRSAVVSCAPQMQDVQLEPLTPSLNDHRAVYEYLFL